MTMNLSFAGCGFLGIYHVGVVSCFNQYAPNLINKLLGASAGAISACCFLCECPLGQITSDALKIATTARNYSLGPFNPKFDVTRILQDRLEQILPADAHVRCSGRLHVSCTRVSDGKNLVLSEFDTKEELIQALLCSSFIPIFSGIMPPTYRGVRYIDGCYSDNLPILDENTITVSPFCGECDICPRDDSYNLLQVNLANTSIELSSQNLYRFMRVLFPPHPEILSQMCKQGFDDALHFLRRNDLISCTRCTAVQSISVKMSEQAASDNSCVSNEEEASSKILIKELPAKEDHEMCIDCAQRRQRALLDDLPEVVLKVLEEACASMNRGIINWVFKHKSMRVLSVLTLPYVLPLDFAYVIFVKFLQLAPKLGQNLLNLAGGIINYIRNVFKRVCKTRHLLRAKFSCQLAISGFDFEADDGYKSTPDCVIATKPILAPNAGHKKARTVRPSRKTSALGLSGKVNFDFSTVSLDPSSPTLAATTTKSTNDVTAASSSPLSSSLDSPRNLSRFLSSASDDGQDTFDRILDVAHQQEALVAGYYLDNWSRDEPNSTLISEWEQQQQQQQLRDEKMSSPNIIYDLKDLSRDSALESSFESDDMQLVGSEQSFCDSGVLNSLARDDDDDGYLLDRVVVHDSTVSVPNENREQAKKISFAVLAE